METPNEKAKMLELLDAVRAGIEDGSLTGVGIVPVAPLGTYVQWGSWALGERDAYLLECRVLDLYRHVHDKRRWLEQVRATLVRGDLGDEVALAR